MSETGGQVNAAAFFGDTALLGDIQAETGAYAAAFTLTAVNGMLVYNSSTNKFQGYENGSWTNLI